MDGAEREYVLQHCFRMEPGWGTHIVLTVLPTFFPASCLQIVVTGTTAKLAKTLILKEEAESCTLAVHTAECESRLLFRLMRLLSDWQMPSFRLHPRSETGRDGEIYVLTVSAGSTSATLRWWTADLPDVRWEKLGEIIEEIQRVEVALDFRDAYCYQAVVGKENGIQNRSWMVEFTRM